MRKLFSTSFAIVIFSCSLLAGCKVPPLLSYPRFWDYTRTKPKDADFVGTYKVLKLRLPTELSLSVRERESAITLKADRTAILTDAPMFNGFGDTLVCRLSGSVNWELDQGLSGGLGWSLTFQHYQAATKPTTGECNYENTMWSMDILSRNAPYRLYRTVGDPDSDTGVEFKRVSR